MKKISLILLFLPLAVDATEICGDWEKKIEPDMQINEADFTKENALNSHKTIGELIESGKFEWFQPLNHQKFIYGYLLKKRALNAIEARGEQEIKSLYAVEKFCRFIVEDAFYYD
ncbi:hypothetical protein [Aliikangiella coralliicola]|uniref:Uncharacterized protein n=1 Tax=Aliikangiella coralliicola TaxID=2592383 RepID=A0A545UFQ2_9GAMM|nr:hypothetical protein [Aliikangiella coralliicola]TQV88297.1 hypothetical protein FLL46_07145 [Aliikangiella coralliicola]